MAVAERLPDAALALSHDARRCLAALHDTLWPPSATAPGALAKAPGTGAGAVAIGSADYVAAALEGAYAGDLPEYRAVLAALDAAAGGRFADAPAAAREAIVARLEAGTLAGLPDVARAGRSSFDLLWRHLREGLFADPVHGGNRDFAGWNAIGFPGAQTGFTAAEQAIDAPVDRDPASFADMILEARLGGLPPLDVLGTAEPDVLIVGGGAVGLLLAHRLVSAGRTVTVLEAGPLRTGRERAMDELSATAFRNAGGAAKFAAEVPTWRTGPDAPARRATMSQGLETALGGNSVAWGAVAMRFYEDDFTIRSATEARHGSGAVPEDSTLADWPLAYADLAPHYDEAEALLGVSGQAGANPFEAPRRVPYEMPPLRTSGLGTLFAEAARGLGYHPFPLPAAILTAPRAGRHACTYCSFCSRFGCHVDAKASAQNTVLAESLGTGRLRIVPHARVLRIETDGSGRATGATWRDRAGDTHFAGAATTVLATYTFENVRLLLLSASPRHPRGLGNGTGQVGAHYMTRQQPSVHAHFAGRRLNRFIGPTAQAMAIADLSGDHFDHAGLGFIRGGRIAAFNQYLPIEASGNLPPGHPRWGAAWRDFFTGAYNSTAMLFIDPEILPYAGNRIDLDPDVTDDLGRPVARITFDIGENERRLVPFLQDRAEEIARAMGASRTWRRPALTGPISTHDVGGTRMGADPQTSVVDGFGRVHDTPGLVVLGGSTFVSLPAVNPALTLFALALRAGDALLGREGAR